MGPGYHTFNPSHPPQLLDTNQIKVAYWLIHYKLPRPVACTARSPADAAVLPCHGLVRAALYPTTPLRLSSWSQGFQGKLMDRSMLKKSRSPAFGIVGWTVSGSLGFDRNLPRTYALDSWFFVHRTFYERGEGSWARCIGTGLGRLLIRIQKGRTKSTSLPSC
jgi:hypothetical protein